MNTNNTQQRSSGYEDDHYPPGAKLEIQHLKRTIRCLDEIFTNIMDENLKLKTKIKMIQFYLEDEPGTPEEHA